MTHMTRKQYKAFLDDHQRKALADVIWDLQLFASDCLEQLREMKADDETIRRMKITVNDIGDQAKKLQEPSIEVLKYEDTVHDDEPDTRELDYQHLRNG